VQSPRELFSPHDELKYCIGAVPPQRHMHLSLRVMAEFYFQTVIELCVFRCNVENLIKFAD